MGKVYLCTTFLTRLKLDYNDKSYNGTNTSYPNSVRVLQGWR